MDTIICLSLCSCGGNIKFKVHKTLPPSSFLHTSHQFRFILLIMQVAWLALQVVCSIYDRHDINEIILKVALNTIKPTNQPTKKKWKWSSAYNDIVFMSNVQRSITPTTIHGTESSSNSLTALLRLILGVNQVQI